MTIACCVGEPEVGKDQADAFLSLLLEGQAVAPALWAVEVGSVLLRKQQSGKLGSDETEKLFGFLAWLPVLIDQTHTSRVFTDIVDLARRWNLTVYDACYVELAIRLRLPIASLDGHLCGAAE